MVEGKSIHRPIHRIVAQHFLNNPKNYEYVHHINHNTSDNYLENLCWGNRSLASKSRSNLGEFSK